MIAALAIAITFELWRGENAHSVAAIIAGLAAIWHPKANSTENEIRDIIDPMSKQITETFTVTNPLNGQVVMWSKSQVLPDAADAALNIATLFGLKEKVSGTYDVEITDAPKVSA